MRPRGFSLGQNAGLLFLTMLLFVAPDLVRAGEGRIRPYEANPQYWQYQGKPVLLLGGSDDDNLFQWTGERLTDHLDLLVSLGGNYLRNTMSDRNDKGFEIFPFARLDDGRYDLNRWNEPYWQRLDDFLRETQRRSIVVQIELWDAFDWQSSATGTPPGPHWDRSPWNPKNNINYTYGQSGLPQQHARSPHHENSPLVLTVPGLANADRGQIVLKYQQSFVRRVLEVALRYDHVLWTVMNETSAPQAWSDYWAQFLHREARTRGGAVFVSDMREGDRLSARQDPQRYQIERPELYPFLDVSKSNRDATGQAHWAEMLLIRDQLRRHHPRPMNVVKLMQRNHPQSESVDRWWRNLLAGVAAQRFHRPDNGLGLTGPAQVLIRGMRQFTDAMNVFVCVPRNDLLAERSANEAYCFAEPGKQYAVYFPEGGQVTLDVSEATGPLQVRWLDITRSIWQGPQPGQGGATLELKTPTKGHWAVLVLAR